MKNPRLLLSLGLLLLLLAPLAWWQGWFASEPVYHGRTVTQWLDAMALFDEVRNRDETGQNMWSYDRTPGAVTADPALRALLALGSNAVPALRIHLQEPPKPGPWWRQLQRRLTVTWMRFWDSTYPAYTPAPPRYGSRDEARSMSAGLALLAMGKELGGGTPPLIEEYATAIVSTNQHVRQFPAGDAIGMAVSGLPRMRIEIRDAIDDSLTHTNPLQRRFAASYGHLFPEEYPRWRPIYLRMAASGEDAVRDAGMFALLVRAKTEDDPEFVALCAQILANKGNSKHLRARATGGIRFGGAKDTNYMSVLRAATNDADSYVQQSARTALKNFERSPK